MFGGLGRWSFGSGTKKNKLEHINQNNGTRKVLQNEKNQKADIGGKLIQEGKNLENTKTNISGNVIKGLEDTGKSLTNLTENVVSGIGNVAGGVRDEMKNEAKAVEDLTGNVAGGVVSGIGNVASGLEGEVGGLFKGLGDWSLGSGNKKEKSKISKQNNTSSNASHNSNNQNVSTKKGQRENDDETGIKNEIANIFTSYGGLNSDKKEKVDESTMDLTFDLEKGGKVNAKDSSTGQASDFNSLFAGLGDLASKMEKGKEKSANVVSTGIGETSNVVKNEFGSIFGGLGGWSSNGSNKKNIDETVLRTTTVKVDVLTITKTIKKESQSGFGGFFGGLKNLASGVSNGITKGEAKLAGISSKVVGGVGGTAGAVENKIGGLFGDWSSGGSNKDQNKAVDTEGQISGSRNEGTVATNNGNNGFGSWFGGDSKKKETSTRAPGGIEKDASGVGNKIFDASKKLSNMGGNFFGFRKKRGLGMGFRDLKDDFNMIFNTIDQIENYVVNDLKHLNNVSVILSPIVDEIDHIVKGVLVGVENELKEATKPLEKLFAATLDKVISVENSILNATHIIQDTQGIISWFEVYRYHVSNFIAAALLISFSLLTFGISVRMTCNNVITKCAYKGGFTLLHVTALLMAVTSLAYIAVGVTSQKVLCETFDSNYREDNIMRILSRINPAKYGLLIDLNLHKVILRCHQDKSLYEVAALKSVMNIEKMALEFFDLDSIEKKFEPLLNVKLDIPKYLPLDTIHTIEEDLNFESFEKILDIPIFAQMEKLEEEFTHIPMVGTVIKELAGKILSFKDKIASIQSPVQSANNGFPNLLTNMKKLLLDVENGLLEIEKKSVKTLEDVVLSFKNLLVTSLNDYVYNRLIYSIEHEVGKCRPISSAFNSTLNSVCRRITTPANGHWFSWFIGVFLSIALIVLSREVNDKINSFREDRERNSSDGSSKKIEEIEMKSFDERKVEIDCEQNEKHPDEAI